MLSAGKRWQGKTGRLAPSGLPARKVDGRSDDKDYQPTQTGPDSTCPFSYTSSPFPAFLIPQTESCLIPADRFLGSIPQGQSG